MVYLISIMHENTQDFHCLTFTVEFSRILFTFFNITIVLSYIKEKNDKPSAYIDELKGPKMKKSLYLSR